MKEEHYWILGHSLGGYVGLELLNSDQRAKGLILLNSNFWIDSPLRKMNRLRSIEVVEENKGLFVRTAIPSLFTDEYRLDNENVVNKLVRSALDMKESVIIAATQWMLKRRDFSSTDLLDSVYLIHGQLDNLIPTEVVKERSEQSLCRYEIVEKVGHMAPFEMEPHAFVSLLQSVLSKMS